MTRAGFPHSGISGSTLVCNSPELIAAYHALHRLLTPRHPPCALSSLVKNCYRPETFLAEDLRCSASRKMLTRHSLFSCQRTVSRKAPVSRLLADSHAKRYLSKAPGASGQE